MASESPYALRKDRWLVITYDKLFDPPALIVPVTVSADVNSRPRSRLVGRLLSPAEWAGTEFRAE